MSFSSEVKEELSLQLSSARHCRLAELSAICSYEGQLIRSGEKIYLKLQTENLVVARKYFTLIRKTFNISSEISVRINTRQNKSGIDTLLATYTLIIRNTKDVIKICQAAKLPLEAAVEGNSRIGPASQLITQNACCKRAFIRGAFLSSGSMSDPRKAYHLEVVTASPEKAEQLRDMIQTFSIDAKIVMRKKNYVVYIKEGSQIVDLLNVMEAHIALMDLENVRILKEMRNSINRQVNCEAANINKTVTAASKQMEDILYIRDTVGFGDLADGLEDIAGLRIDYPEASLKELGAMLRPPIGKSGVNHRLRKLSMIADQLREHKEENSHDNEGNCN
jgi:DNA-binding protein WhiA